MSGPEDVRKALGKLRTEGGRESLKRVIRRAYQRLDVASLDFPLMPGDLADSAALDAGLSLPLKPREEKLTIGWLTTPPGAGSGGHTTMFRMIQALENAGHRCIIYLYDRHHGSVEDHAAVIAQSWPWVHADVRSVDEGLRGIDGCVATSWQTAHVLASRSAADLHRFYFIQDFEPFFYPRGSEYELAADTYRFGFRNIALGHMVQDRLRHELEVDAQFVPFSCDTSIYSLTNTGPRSGIVFYAKPDVSRRGYRLGALALKEFHHRHPEHEIHVYGDPEPEILTPVTRHGRLTPRQLNALYNTTRAGIAMSFTNISLVAEEMLAAGTIPVVNDSADSRADLSNPYVAWSLPTAHGIADALCTIVEGPDTAAHAAAAVRGGNWQETGAALTAIIEQVVYAEGPDDHPKIRAEAGGQSSPAPTGVNLARATP